MRKSRSCRFSDFSELADTASPLEAVRKGSLFAGADDVRAGSIPASLRDASGGRDERERCARRRAELRMVRPPPLLRVQVSLLRQRVHLQQGVQPLPVGRTVEAAVEAARDQIRMPPLALPHERDRPSCCSSTVLRIALPPQKTRRWREIPPKHRKIHLPRKSSTHMLDENEPYFNDFL